MKNYLGILILLSITFLSSCDKEDNTITTSSCDFNTLIESSSDTYSFDSNLSDYFLQTNRWESVDATIAQNNDIAELTANATDISQALEAWLTYKEQVPYNQSWEFSVDLKVPLAWNTASGNEPQVGIGIFVGKPEPSGQSKKVYECNLAVVANAQRFVQGQLIANRLGDDPIKVDRKVLSDSKETANMKLRYCAEDHTISLLLDNEIIGTQAIDASGRDDWGLSDSDVLDIGIMGFAENTVITQNPPSLDNFELSFF